VLEFVASLGDGTVGKTDGLQSRMWGETRKPNVVSIIIIIIIIIMIIIIIISWAFRLAPALCRRKDASTAPAALSGLGDPFSGSRLGIEDA